MCPSHWSQVLEEVLDREFNGELSCDYSGAYRKFMAYRRYTKDVNVQFCPAHFVHNLKFLVDHPPKRIACTASVC